MKTTTNSDPLKVGNSFKSARGVQKITRITARMVYYTEGKDDTEYKEPIKDVSVKIKDGFWQLVQPKAKKAEVKLTNHEELVLAQIQKEKTIIRSEMTKMRAFAQIKSCRGAADSLAKKGVVKKIHVKAPKVAGKFQVAYTVK